MSEDTKLVIPALPPGGVSFVFSGGPRDGETDAASTAPLDDPVDSAQGLWILTRGGQVGRTFRQVSPGHWEAFKKHGTLHPADGAVTGIGGAQSHYEITGKQDDGMQVIVECEYRGPSKPK